MKSIEIKIYDEKDKPLEGLIKINSADMDFYYSNSGNFHGLKTYAEEDSYWNVRMGVLLNGICKNLRELIEIDKMLNKGRNNE